MAADPVPPVLFVESDDVAGEVEQGVTSRVGRRDGRGVDAGASSRLGDPVELSDEHAVVIPELGVVAGVGHVPVV